MSAACKGGISRTLPQVNETTLGPTIPRPVEALDPGRQSILAAEVIEDRHFVFAIELVPRGCERTSNATGQAEILGRSHVLAMCRGDDFVPRRLVNACRISNDSRRFNRLPEPPGEKVGFGSSIFRKFVPSILAIPRAKRIDGRFTPRLDFLEWPPTSLGTGATERLSRSRHQQRSQGASACVPLSSKYARSITPPKWKSALLHGPSEGLALKLFEHPLNN